MIVPIDLFTNHLFQIRFIKYFSRKQLLGAALTLINLLYFILPYILLQRDYQKVGQEIGFRKPELTVAFLTQICL